MITEVPSDYRTLALDSSNEMLAYDSRWVLGRYSEAAWHALQAGHGRRRMGSRMRDEGQFAQAASDWLAAAACYLMATQHSLALTELANVHELNRAGLLPPDRSDIHGDIKEREAELQNLKQRITAFRDEYTQRFAATRDSNAARLKFLLAHLRDFPGFADLHFAIYRQARLLGDANLAAEHLHWAAEFAPEEAEFVGRYGYHLIAAGRADQATELARRFLSQHPDEPSIRVLFAQSLVSRGGTHRPDPEGALGALQAVSSDPKADGYVRLAALALSSVIQHARGEDHEADRLRAGFDQLAAAIAADEARIAPICNLLAFSKNGIGSSAEGLETAVAEPFLSELFRRDEEMASRSPGGKPISIDY